MISLINCHLSLWPMVLTGACAAPEGMAGAHHLRPWHSAQWNGILASQAIWMAIHRAMREKCLQLVNLCSEKCITFPNTYILPALLRRHCRQCSAISIAWHNDVKFITLFRLSLHNKPAGVILHYATKIIHRVADVIAGLLNAMSSSRAAKVLAAGRRPSATTVRPSGLKFLQISRRRPGWNLSFILNDAALRSNSRLAGLFTLQLYHIF